LTVYKQKVEISTGGESKGKRRGKKEKKGKRTEIYSPRGWGRNLKNG